MPKNRVARPMVPAQLFHEVLGQELTQKFFALSAVDDTVKASSLAFLAVDSQHRYHPDVYPQALDKEKSLRNGAFLAAQVITAPSHALIHRASMPVLADEHSKIDKTSFTYHLDDMNALQAIEGLLSRWGRMTHMGVRDHSYRFFLNKARTGVLSYRVINKVAVISGDPICALHRYNEVLDEFQIFCKKNRWQFAISGASSDMAGIAKARGWTTVHFGRERVLNAQTNPVLLGTEGKRIRTQCKQLMKSGSQVSVYYPAHKRDLELEREMTELYEDWRGSRNGSRDIQAYVTVFDLFSLHHLMMFLYTTDAAGKVNGFAALRRLKDGYHVDPCIAAPDAPRGLVDLLLVASMALLNQAGIQRLALGVEPLSEFGEITGMSKNLERLTRRSHKMVSAELPLGGKKAFNDRFRPDDALEEQLYLVYPNSPSIRQSIAMAHFANVSIHTALKHRYARQLQTRKRKLLHTAGDVAALSRPQSRQKDEA